MSDEPQIQVYVKQAEIVVKHTESTDIYPFSEGWSLQDVVDAIRECGFTFQVTYDGESNGL